MSAAVYRRYLLAVLLVIYAFNTSEGVALGLLIQDIKADLSLSDTQLGFLNGIAFALFYSIMGVPIARWADRGNRVTVIVVTTALWGLFVAMSGLATSFLQLLLIRVGVAVGEAGCVPAAHSLIADYFPRKERPRAVAVYLLGGSLSVVIGYCLAGWTSHFYGWRVAFLLVGAPGLILSLLVRATLREPRRHGVHPGGVITIPAPEAFLGEHQESTLAEVWTVLWKSRTFRQLLLGYSVMSFFVFGITKWLPAFFIRSYHLDTGVLGTWFAVVCGIAGVSGIYLGGEWATRRAIHNEGLQLKAIALAYCVLGIVTAFIYLSSNVYLAFGIMGVGVLGGATIGGPLFATIQTLVPERMRATAVAMLYLFANLIGMGLGPVAVGALSDAFRPWAGVESLRYALLALCPGYLWGAWHLWRASGTVAHDLGVNHLSGPRDEQLRNQSVVHR